MSTGPVQLEENARARQGPYLLQSSGNDRSQPRTIQLFLMLTCCGGGGWAEAVVHAQLRDGRVRRVLGHPAAGVAAHRPVLVIPRHLPVLRHDQARPRRVLLPAMRKGNLGLVQFDLIVSASVRCHSPTTLGNQALRKGLLPRRMHAPHGQRPCGDEQRVPRKHG